MNKKVKKARPVKGSIKSITITTLEDLLDTCEHTLNDIGKIEDYITDVKEDITNIMDDIEYILNLDEDEEEEK